MVKLMNCLQLIFGKGSMCVLEESVFVVDV